MCMYRMVSAQSYEKACERSDCGLHCLNETLLSVRYTQFYGLLVQKGICKGNCCFAVASRSIINATTTSTKPTVQFNASRGRHPLGKNAVIYLIL